MAKALITTVPFAQRNKRPLELLESTGIEYTINPIGRKLREAELAEMIGDYELLIAGTEPITAKVLQQAQKLQFISRVGIGLDSVDLIAAEKHGIQVSYTPDAPATAVAELTLGLILSLLRYSHVSNIRMHQGEWHRYFGRQLTEVTLGIIGVGRIGSRVIQAAHALGAKKLLANDLRAGEIVVDGVDIHWCDKEEIYRMADVISLHLPLSRNTHEMILYEHLKDMKPDALIINTSRGGIIHEKGLAMALKEGHLGGAAIDVFEHEPYDGELVGIDNCLLTAHMGSMSINCRSRMEIEATEEVVRFYQNEPLQGQVPEDEYNIQRQVL